MIGQICKHSHNRQGIVDFSKEIAIAESWRDWYGEQRKRKGINGVCVKHLPCSLANIRYREWHMQNNETIGVGGVKENSKPKETKLIEMPSLLWFSSQ